MSGWTPVTEDTLKPKTPAGWAVVPQQASNSETSFEQKNKLDPFNRQANEFLLGAASGMSGLPETEHPIKDALKQPPPSVGNVLKDPSTWLGPGGSILSSIFNAGKEMISGAQPGESEEDVAARRAHGIGSVTGQVAAVAMGEGEGRARAEIDAALPSAKRAGVSFESLKKTIGQHPVAVTDELSKSLNELRQSSTTTNTNIPPVVKKLMDRLDPFQGGAQLTYDEARQFSSEIGHLSAADKMSLTPNTKRLIGNLDHSLTDTVQGTADLAGQGDKLSKAMSEYHHAMQIRNVSEAIKQEFWKTVLTGAGIYAGKKIWDAAGSGGK